MKIKQVDRKAKQSSERMIYMFYAASEPLLYSVKLCDVPLRSGQTFYR